MFDTLKALSAGFAQRLAATKADKLVWLLFAAFAAGWLATAFAAWVSYPSYSAAVSFLPNGQTIAALATGGIAAVVYFCLSNLSGFAVERWRGTEPSSRNYEALGARIVAIVAALGMTLDIYMNLQGSEYRAKDAAGSVATFQYKMDPQMRTDYTETNQRLDDLLRGKLGGYGWRDPRTGIFHLNNSGKKYQRELSAKQRRIQIADSTERVNYIAGMNAKNAERADIEGMAKESLTKAVWGVYGFILLLCILQAYCVEVIQETLGQSVSRVSRKSQSQSSDGFESPRPSAATRSTAQASKTVSLPLEPSKTEKTSETDSKRRCPNCQKEVTGRKNKIYCSEECRQTAWEQRNGKRLRRGRKTPNA